MARGAARNLRLSFEPHRAMSFVNRLISAGFATAALASASVPALGVSAWSGVDADGYAGAARPAPAEMVPDNAPPAMSADSERR
jgi:hypothetical protein